MLYCLNREILYSLWTRCSTYFCIYIFCIQSHKAFLFVFLSFLNCEFLKLIYFNWRIITLQYCDGFLFPFLSKVPSFLLLSFPSCLESFPLPFTNSKSVNKKCYKFSLIQGCLYFPFIPEGYFADHGIQVWFFFFFFCCTIWLADLSSPTRNWTHSLNS